MTDSDIRQAIRTLDDVVSTSGACVSCRYFSKRRPFTGCMRQAIKAIVKVSDWASAEQATCWTPTDELTMLTRLAGCGWVNNIGQGFASMQTFNAARSLLTAQRVNAPDRLTCEVGKSRVNKLVTFTSYDDRLGLWEDKYHMVIARERLSAVLRSIPGTKRYERRMRRLISTVLHEFCHIVRDDGRAYYDAAAIVQLRGEAKRVATALMNAVADAQIAAFMSEIGLDEKAAKIVPRAVSKHTNLNSLGWAAFVRINLRSYGGHTLTAVVGWEAMMKAVVVLLQAGRDDAVTHEIRTAVEHSVLHQTERSADRFTRKRNEEK